MTDHTQELPALTRLMETPIDWNGEVQMQLEAHVGAIREVIAALGLPADREMAAIVIFALLAGPVDEDMAGFLHAQIVAERAGLFKNGGRREEAAATV